MRGTATYASLSAVLDHYRDSGWNADIALVTGDVIQDDTAAAYGHFRDLLGRLGMPVHCVPGNHDIRKLMRQALADPPFHYCEPRLSGSWLVIGIDSCVSGQAGGHIEAAELDRLDAAIAATPASHVMVCLHHPPVKMGSKWLDSVGLDNGAEFLRRVSSADKVRLAVFGHVHQPYDAVHSGVRIIGTPSTCRQFAPRSDTFAVDDNPPAYRRFALHADGRVEQELIWIGK